jgi:cysteinyl-tRNA synthetase
MSKSKGNILYTSTLIENGYSPAEIRFFLLYGHYRKRLNYTDASMQNASLMLHEIRDVMKCLRKKAASAVPVSSPLSTRLLEAFGECLDNDMDLKGGIDAVRDILFSADISAMSPARASGMMRTLRKIDEVLQVIF